MVFKKPKRVTFLRFFFKYIEINQTEKLRIISIKNILSKSLYLWKKSARSTLLTKPVYVCDRYDL